MWLKVDDGKVVFATHAVRLKRFDSIPEELRSELALRYQLEGDQFIAYSFNEAQEVAGKLKECGVEDFNTEELQVPVEHTSKVKGVKYANCDEAKDHILRDKEPESLVLPRLYEQINTLQQNNEALRNRVKICEDALLGVIFKGFKGA